MLKTFSKIFFVVVILGAGFLFANEASAATYYVSNTNVNGIPVGNDSNAGTIEAPWLTVGKARATYASGDTIYINDGTYLTSDGASGASTLTIAKPSTWRSVTTRGATIQGTNLTNTMVITPTEAGAITVGDIIIDSQGTVDRCATISNTAYAITFNLDGTKCLNPITYGYVVSETDLDFTATNIDITVSSMAANGRGIQAISSASGAFNFSGVALNISGNVAAFIYGIELKSSDGGVDSTAQVSGVTGTVSNPNTSGTVVGVLIRNIPNAVIENSNLTLEGGGPSTSLGLKISSQGYQSDGSIIRNNTVTMLTAAGYTVQIGESNSGAEDNKSNNGKIYGNTITGIENGQVGTPHGIAIGPNTGGEVYNNTAINFSPGILVAKTDSTTIIHNNIIKKPYGNQQLYCKGCTGTKFYNNTVYAYTGYNGKCMTLVAHGDGTNNSNVEYKNNLCYNSSTNPIFVQINNSQTGTFANNLYYTSEPTISTSWSYQASNYSSLTDWMSAGHETNAIFSDPLLLSSSDFHLTALSPAINAGTNVSLTSDFVGTAIPQGASPDIGAYEYLLPSAPTIGSPSVLSSTSLRWTFTDNATNETGFKVYDNTNTLASSSAVTNLSYLDETGLSANTQYTGRYVTAYNSAGDSTHSATASSIYTKIESPTGASWSSIGVDSITLSASGTLSNLTSGTSGLYFANTTASTNSGWTQTNSWQNNSLSENTQYAFQITSRNGDSFANTAVDVGSKYTLADTPTNLSASSNSNSVTLSVDSFPNDTSGQSGYYFSRSGTNSGWIQTNSWTDTGLSCSHEYTYTVKYRNGDGTETSEISTTKSTSGCGGGGSPAIWTLPTVPTGGFKISINGGVATTTNRNVILGFNAGTDIKKMAISMTGDFTDASQEDYVAFKQWDLCSKLGGAIKNPTCPDGTYKVYVQFYTVYGRSSAAASVSSSITLKSAATITENLQQPITNNSPSSSPFTKYLQYRQTSPDIKRLQIFLNSDPDTRIADTGAGSPGKETNYFGLLTYKAVIKFQEKYAKDVLAPWGFVKGTGYVGKTTLAKINELMTK